MSSARNFHNIVVSSTRFVPVLDQHDTPSTGQGGKIELRPPVGQDHVLRHRHATSAIAKGDLKEEPLSGFTGCAPRSASPAARNSDWACSSKTTGRSAASC